MKEDKINLVDWDNLVYYDETSPSCLRWKIDVGANFKIKAGTPAGSRHKTNNQYEIRYNKILYKVHRVIYFLHNGRIDNTLKIDHINGDSLDNRISNIRLVSQKINAQNSKMKSTNTSGVNGVVLNDKGGGRLYWVTIWEENGIPKRKSFNIYKFGDAAAFQMACEYRKSVIDNLNKMGCSYSERHGL